MVEQTPAFWDVLSRTLSSAGDIPGGVGGYVGSGGATGLGLGLTTDEDINGDGCGVGEGRIAASAGGGGVYHSGNNYHRNNNTSSNNRSNSGDDDSRPYASGVWDGDGDERGFITSSVAKFVGVVGGAINGHHQVDVPIRGSSRPSAEGLESSSSTASSPCLSPAYGDDVDGSGKKVEIDRRDSRGDVVVGGGDGACTSSPFSLESTFIRRSREIKDVSNTAPAAVVAVSVLPPAVDASHGSGSRSSSKSQDSGFCTSTATVNSAATDATKKSTMPRYVVLIKGYKTETTVIIVSVVVIVTQILTFRTIKVIQITFLLIRPIYIYIFFFL